MLPVLLARSPSAATPGPDRDWLKHDYDRVDRVSARFVPCAPDTARFSDDGVVGEETAWAGGFVVRRESCGALLVRREGEERWRKLRVGFGVRCTGA
jgi:hypothetical protein